MKKRYQVFVSSTYEDLIEERKMVIDALLESECIPAGMELFASTNESSWERIKKVIQESDYYLLIISGKYGSIAKPINNNISFTELEYDYAVEIGKPIIAFIRENVESLPVNMVEKKKTNLNKLNKFIEKIKTSYLVSKWKNKHELLSQIKSSISRIVIDYPTTGWIRYSEDEEEKVKLLNTLGDVANWNLTRIFNTRAEKNQESDPLLEKHNVKRLDGIAFGLRSFRSRRRNDILECLNNGMQVRLLVMDPNGEFIKQREIEEKAPQNTIKNSIEALVEWAKELNKESKNGKVLVKYYNCMTLDFYWRVDNVLYIGPYMQKVESQQTITYKFEEGRGFRLYEEYFENLWNDDSLTKNAIL